MNRRSFLLSSVAGLAAASATASPLLAQASAPNGPVNPNRKILSAGGGFTTPFLR